MQSGFELATSRADRGREIAAAKGVTLMGRWVLLITHPTVSLPVIRERLAALQPIYEIHALSETDLLLHDRNDPEGHYGWIRFTPEVVSEYEPGELNLTGIEQPHIFILEIGGRVSEEGYLTFLRRCLGAIADDRQVWVDNDFGDMWPGPEVVERLRRDPTWRIGIPTYEDWVRSHDRSSEE